MDKTLEKLQQLIQLTRQLRNKKTGDPWILKQNFKTLAPLTVEEAYEFAHSVLENNHDAMADELGDLILHVFLYAQIAQESSEFNLDSIIEHTLEKQQRRKLEFNNPEKISEADALKRWEEKKREEQDSDARVLANIPTSLPALNRALKIQQRAANVGFDWPNAESVFAKIEEELEEIKVELSHDTINQQSLEQEVGDLFFSCINLARKLNISPETAINSTNKKFIKRFEGIENALAEQNKSFDETTLDEMDKLWEQQKDRT